MTDYAGLEEKDWKFFDNWAAMFTKRETITELSLDGGGLRTNTYLTLQNLRILARTFRKFADIKLESDLPFIRRPKLKNGKRTVIEVEPTEAFLDAKQEFLTRAQNIGNPRLKGADNMLAITTDMRQAALDMQLIDPSVSETQAGNKIPAICDNVASLSVKSPSCPFGCAPPRRLLLEAERN